MCHVNRKRFSPLHPFFFCPRCTSCSSWLNKDSVVQQVHMTDLFSSFTNSMPRFRFSSFATPE
ncbi:hypothetical protein IF2G_08362 [Cordyceps javanica]|nr:hypothetical protein IF2G_08362 [Cordyceps javanica]